MRLFSIILIILFCIVPSSWAEDKAQKEELQKAKDFYISKIRSKPEDLDLHRELMEMYSGKGLISIPIEIYKASVEKFPDNPITNYVLGYAYLLEESLGSLKMAQTYLERALELKPEFPDALTALGDYYLKVGREDLALAKWQSAISINDKFEPAHLSLARFYRSHKEFGKAIEEYQEIIPQEDSWTVRSSTKTGKIYLELGLTYMEMGDLVKAEEALLKAKRHDSKSGIIYYKLGQVYAMRGDRDQAIDMYRKGRKYDPNNARAAYELAHIFLGTNDIKYALLSMERGLSADGAKPELSKKLIALIEKSNSSAIDFMEQLTNSEYSNNFDLHYFLGKFHLKSGNDDLALKHLELAEALSPLHPDVHYQLGIIYERRQEVTQPPATAEEAHSQPQLQTRPRDAEEQYRKAVELGADSADLLFKVAQGYLNEGNEEKFIEVAQKALVLNPNRSDVHLQLAAIFQKRADIYKASSQKTEEEKALESAIKHYEQVVSLQPDAQKWYNLGLLYERYGKGKALKAVRAYDQAIQLDPNFALAYYRRGDFMLNYKVGPAKLLVYQPETAVEDLKKAIELDPKLSDAHVSLGMAYHQMNMPELATAEFLKAVESDPNNVKAHIYLAQDYAETGENQKVIYHLLRAAELDSGNVEVLKDLAAMLLKYGSDADVKQARDALEKAIKLKPDDPEILMNYGYILYLDSMFNSAIEHLKRALEIQPNYPEAHYNIALAYSRIGQHQLSLQHWEMVLKQAPQSEMASRASEYIKKLKGSK